MSYRPKAIEIMIASPSDVRAEFRQVIRNVIQEWNYAHSKDKNIVLMPIGWESHSAPAMGDRPQAIINKQVLADCDLLIAVFWTKLGTPTGKAASGTVEEIEEHLRARKPAMIYFSSVPVLLDSIDREQYEALQEFKAQLREKGLYAEFESSEDFREKFARQLAQTVNRHFASKKNAPDEGANGLIHRPKLPALSDMAIYLLIEASQDRNGAIYKLRRRHGWSVQTNGNDLVEHQGPRSAPRWVAALNELREKRFVEDRSRDGDVFALTDEGYRVADLLKEKTLVLH